MTYKKDYAIVFEACKKALNNLEIIIDTADKDKKTITGSSQTSFWSWGENIQINFEKVNSTSTKIEVESSSKAQFFDWGKNEENEEKIINEVFKILEEK